MGEGAQVELLDGLGDQTATNQKKETYGLSTLDVLILAFAPNYYGGEHAI